MCGRGDNFCHVASTHYKCQFAVFPGITQQFFGFTHILDKILTMLAVNKCHNHSPHYALRN